MATAIATLCAIDLITGLFMIGCWLIVAFLFRISSLAAILGFCGAMGYGYLYAGLSDMQLWVTGAISVLSILRHRENIKRLINARLMRDTAWTGCAYSHQPYWPILAFAKTLRRTRDALSAIPKLSAHDPKRSGQLQLRLTVCRWCHVSADIVQSFLLDLELAGQVQRHSSGRVSCLISED